MGHTQPRIGPNVNTFQQKSRNNPLTRGDAPAVTMVNENEPQKTGEHTFDQHTPQGISHRTHVRHHQQKPEPFPNSNTIASVVPITVLIPASTIGLVIVLGTVPILGC